MRRRFDPPMLSVGPEERWVLLAAFASAPFPMPASLDRAKAAAVARDLDLCRRIAHRFGLRAFGDEERLVGAVAAGILSGERSATLVASLDRISRTRRVPMVLLKGAALVAAGFAAPAVRIAVDVDVLVPIEAWHRLLEALEEEGFTRAGPSQSGHQLDPLVHPDLGSVDVHLHIPGVKLPGTRHFARYADLFAGGLLRPAPGVSGAMLVPTRSVLVAHAIAHGLAQSGLAPWAYPGFRLIGDLLDLGVELGDGDARRVPGLWLRGTVDPIDLAAATRLAARLGEGDTTVFDERAARSPEGTLLRHLLAGAEDGSAYRDALRLRGLLRGGISGESRPVTVCRRLWRVLLPPPSALRVRYARLGGEPSAARLRLLHVGATVSKLSRSLGALWKLRAPAGSAPPRSGRST